MAIPTLIAMSLTVGWMLSPDVLVRLGHGVAENRTIFLAALSLSSLLAALTVSLIRNPELRYHGRCSQAGLLVQGTGRIPAMTFLLASRLSLALLLPTGLLVTAGFAFNEIFLYWFPNFGFAFLLLGAICLIHLLGERFARGAQLIFAVLVLLSFLILCLAGLGGGASTTPVSADTDIAFSGSHFVGAILLFLGYDYVTPPRQSDSRIPALAAMFFCLLLFLFWSMLSLQYVGPERLGNTTIPYMLAAREILGEPGRYIMGVAIISGVCGAVNGIFLLATGTLNELSSRDLLPGHPPGNLKRRRFIVIFGLIIGAFLMGGLAGYEILETYIQGALLIWLLLIALQCVGAARMLGKLQQAQAWQGYFLASVYLMGTVYLIITHNQTADLVRFLLLTLSACGILSGLWLWIKPAYELTPATLDMKGETS